MDYTTLIITKEQAENTLLKSYGIHGIASKLPGYVDFNFRIKVKNNDCFVLKISRPEENKKYVRACQAKYFYFKFLIYSFFQIFYSIFFPKSSKFF